MHTHLPGQQQGVGTRCGRQPAAIAVGVQITLVVERDRLDDHHHPPVGGGHRQRTPKQGGGLIGAADDHQGDAGDLPDRGQGVIVVEVAAEALLVREPRDADHHRRGEGPVGEEAGRGRLTPELIEGVVQVGEVLDLRHGQEPQQAGALGEAEDRGLVEQGVEDPAWPEPVPQAAGHAVHATFDGDVLTEHQGFRAAQQLVVQGGTQRRREGALTGLGRLLRQSPGVDAAAGARLEGQRRQLLTDAVGMVWGQGRQHLLTGAQRRDPVQACCPVPHLPAAGGEQVLQPSPADRPRGEQLPTGPAQRVTLLVGLDHHTITVGLLEVAAGMPPQPDGAQVEEHRTTCGAGQRDRVGRGRPHLVELPLGDDVGQVGQVADGACHPVRRGRHGDAQPVVLAHEQHRGGGAVAYRPAGGVERGLARRVVERGITEGHHADGIVGHVRRGGGLDPGGPPPIDGDGRADGLGKVGADGRGLGDDPPRTAAPHLVPTTGDGVLPVGEQGTQHVVDGAGARPRAACPSQEQRPRAVVEESGVTRPGQRAEGHVVLVPGGTDGVVAGPGLPQLACHHIDGP